MINTDHLNSERLKSLENWSQRFSDLREYQSFFVSIHGVPIEFRFNNLLLFQKLSRFFPYSWQTSEIDSALIVYWQSPETQSQSWEDVSDPNCFFHDDFTSQRDFLCRKLGKGVYQLMARHRIDDGLYNFLRFLLPDLALRDSQLFFHSSTVVDRNGQAHVFFGPSGAGKTTISQLCEGGLVLGDDMNLLSCLRGQVFIETAAVGQRHFDPQQFGRRYPVKAFYRLHQNYDYKHDLVIEGVKSLLLSSVAGLFWQQMAEDEVLKVFSILEEVRQKVPVYNLHFPKQKEVWPYVQSIE